MQICPLTLMERGQICRHCGRLILIGLSLICRKDAKVSGADAPSEAQLPYLADFPVAGLVDFVQDGAQRCYYVSRPRLVSAMLALLEEDEPVIRKNSEEIKLHKQLAAGACCVQKEGSSS